MLRAIRAGMQRAIGAAPQEGAAHYQKREKSLQSRFRRSRSLARVPKLRVWERTRRPKLCFAGGDWIHGLPSLHPPRHWKSPRKGAFPKHHLGTRGKIPADRQPLDMAGTIR